MTKQFLNTLVCRSCGQQFTVSRHVRVRSERIEYAVIQCGCAEFPVVNGILIHKRDEKTQQILSCVAAGDTWKALKKSFDYKPDLNKMFMATASNSSFGYTLLGYLLCLVTLSWPRTKIPLYRLLNLAGKLHVQVFWTTYLKHRFSATSFWCSLPFLRMIDPTVKQILDIGCGTGIFSFMIGKRVPESRIVCQNLEFTGLFLARQYFVPEANFICSDAGEKHPFPGEFFDVVFSCDALQYVSDREAACQEVVRLLKPEGLALLTHNHVPGFRDYAAQGPRGDFFDTTTIRQIFNKLGINITLVDESLIYQTNFPPLDYPGTLIRKVDVTNE